MLRYILHKTIFLLAVLMPTFCYGLTFPVPKSGRIVGSVQSAQLQADDDYSIVAQRFDIGYYELYEANPGINPDNPQAGMVLVVPTQYLLPAELSLQKSNIVIDTAEMRLFYYSAEKKRIFTYPIGIGKEGWDTPTGHFYIMQKIVHPKWIIPDSIRKYRAKKGEILPKYVADGPNNPMGDYAMRLSDPSYLIHGTDDPVGVGRRSSAGCIRLYPADIKELFAMVSIKTPVTIIDQPYKVAIVGHKVYLEAHMPLYEDRKDHAEDFKSALELVEKAVKNSKIKIDKTKVIEVAKEHIGVPVAVNQ